MTDHVDRAADVIRRSQGATARWHDATPIRAAQALADAGLLSAQPGEYDRGYDDGYQAAAADEDAIDARNRILLEALRSDVVSRCRTWRSMTDDTGPPPPAITIISTGNDLQRAALALAHHCAPRTDT